MEKVQRHLDIHAKKAVQQATRRMLNNKTSREIVAEEVAENEQALEEVAKSKKARDVVVKEMSDEELLAEMRRRGLTR